MAPGFSKTGSQSHQVTHASSLIQQFLFTTCPVYVGLVLTAGLPRWDGADLCRQLVLREDPVELNRFQRWMLARQSPPTHLLKTSKGEPEKKFEVNAGNDSEGTCEVLKNRTTEFLEKT